MASPFPGMDPYLEAQGFWESFHAMLIACCAEVLNRDLPDAYVAQVETRIALIGCDEPVSERVPDVLIGRDDRESSRQLSSPAAGIATIEPITLPLAGGEVEIRERWIEIARLPERELVTVIEILSPGNKSGSGRTDYLAKRQAFINRPVTLVEIDLLLSGAPMPMGRRLPPGDYFATVAHAQRRPNAEVYAWSMRQPLPSLPVPLRAPDRDVNLNLAEVVPLAYTRGGYPRLVRYGISLPASLPIAPGDRAWAEGHAAARLE